MDRRKSEGKLQLKKLQDECRSTVDLLNKLLETCSTQMNIFDMIKSKDFRLYSQNFVTFMQFQYQSFQKLLDINVDLEEHIVENELPSLEQFDFENTLINASLKDLAKAERVLTKPEVLVLDVDVLRSQTNNCNEEIDTNKSEPHFNGQCNNSDKTKPEKVERVLIKPEVLPLDADVFSSQTNNCNEELDSNKSEPHSNHLCNNSEKTKLGTCTGISIIDKLKDLSKTTKKEKVVLDPVPGVGLQRSQKKMSAITKEQLMKDNDMMSSLTVVDALREENFPVFEDAPITDIKNRVDPKINDLCSIGHIESPSRFYIQVADENSSNLDLLSIQLESLSCHNCANVTKFEANKALGNFCCIKISDLWYRVEILDWMLNATGVRQDHVLLQLIDYGNTVHANYKELCPMLRELFNIPKMAQLCHLDSLHPPGSTSKNILTNWSEESTDGFLNICGDLSSSIFQITHVLKDGSRDSFAIELINTEEGNDDNSIGQILLDANLAVEIFDQPLVGNSSIINQILMSHGLKNIKPNMTRDEILEMYFAQNNISEARTINEAVMDYDPRDEANTCKNLRKDGTCYKGDRCTLQHIPLKDGFTRDKHPVYNRAFVDLEMPSTGDEVLLTISHVCAIRHFYAQIRNTCKRDHDKPTINALISEMNKPETVKQYKTLRYPPGLSQLVIVKHWNSHWYRGQVINVTIPENRDSAVIEVLVVDFGDSLIVAMSDLRMIMREFLTVPFQAIECRLFNVRHKQGADEAEEKRYFESRYLGQTFKAKIVAVPGYLEVLLFTKDGEDLGGKLIADGYGEENTEHIFPKDNEIYLID